MVIFKSIIMNENKYKDLFISFKCGDNDIYIICDLYSNEEICNVINVINIIKEKIEKNGFHSLIEFFGKTKELYMKASIAIMEISQGFAAIISSGDCRVYIDGYLITSDDSCFWKRKENLGFSKENIAQLCCRSSLRKKIINKLNPSIDASFTVHNVKLDNSHIVMCTDGFWEIYHNDIIGDNLKYIMNSKKLEDDALMVLIKS